jgi:spermidine synthase
MIGSDSCGKLRGSRFLREPPPLSRARGTVGLVICMSIINIGVIGCGHWVPNHVRVCSQLKESRVATCVDLDAKRLELMREHQPQVRRGFGATRNGSSP